LSSSLLYNVHVVVVVVVLVVVAVVVAAAPALNSAFYFCLVMCEFDWGR